MKKLLFLIPLVFVMATSSWAQDPSMNKSKMKQAALDGRSFKIKLKSESTSYNDKSSVGTQTRTTTTTTTDQKTTDQSVKTTPDNTRVDVATQMQTDKMSQDNNRNEDMKTSNPAVDVNSFDNKSMVLKFSNGMVHSSYMRTGNFDNCPYNISNANTSVQASTSFNATCVSNEQTNTTTTIDQTSKNYDQSTNTNKSDQNKTTIDQSTKITYEWEGTINGKNINGTLTKKMNDGNMAIYSFTGVETKESDNSKDLGLK